MTLRGLQLEWAVVLMMAAALGRELRPGAQVSEQSGGSNFTVFVSATDRQHLPIADLGAGDFVVKEDGKERAVLSAVRATRLSEIVVLVDDNGTGIFRYGLARLAESLQERAEMSIRVVTNQVQTVVDFTANVKLWLAGINRLSVRPATPEGGQLIEGVFAAASDLRKREAKRPVILALSVGGSEQSPRMATDVLEELWRSRAALYVVFAETIARPAPSVSKPSDLLENNFNLNKVIGDGPKESGGIRRDLLTAGLVQNAVQRIATDLRDQYELTYTRPPGGNPPRRLQVAVKRNGVSVIAPTRAPSR